MSSTMSNNKLLNSSRLSKSLQDALQADAKRQVCILSRAADCGLSCLCWSVLQAIDSAKKRAVGQHVDYETFQNMVS